MSGIRLPDCSKLAVNWKNVNDVSIFRHVFIVKCFWRCVVSLVNFRYWSKFHINIITCSGFMTISFYKGLTRNPEIGNTPISVLPNVWSFTKFSTNVSNKMLLNAQNARVKAFTVFQLLKGKPTGRGYNYPHSSPRLGLKKFWIIESEVYFVCTWALRFLYLISM